MITVIIRLNIILSYSSVSSVSCILKNYSSNSKTFKVNLPIAKTYKLILIYLIIIQIGDDRDLKFN